MRIAICDDEPIFIHQLHYEIENYASTKDLCIVIDNFTSVDILLPKIEKFDVVFLDIRFNGENIGINWAHQLRLDGNETIIVMYSSLTTEVFQSFKARPLRFLTKPINRWELFETLDECVTSIATQGKRITIKSDFCDAYIGMLRIAYIESFQRHRTVVLRNEKRISTIESLKGIYEKLDKNLFGYCHKSFVVQYRMVDYIEQQTIHLITKDKIPLARSYAKAFKDCMSDAVWENRL